MSTCLSVLWLIVVHECSESMSEADVYVSVEAVREVCGSVRLTSLNQRAVNLGYIIQTMSSQ